MSNKHLSRFPLRLAGRHRSPKNDVIYKQACMKSHPTEREVRCRRRRCSQISLDAHLLLRGKSFNCILPRVNERICKKKSSTDG
ncbi:hypothetical protein CEXT_756051 [Caerostris extrusa]|uniref:Uncharacterized protein n=1 Tax=Caerostris extrusa TaxID=172846 RepID=A0AAV4R4V3_CAEEX|nr:hypothetical protein CEXT_756051 [Caerostris extrusa]